MGILLVEDDSRMAGVIAKGLREQSYAVDVAHDGEAGRYQAAINDYDVIVLDVLLPKSVVTRSAVSSARAATRRRP